MRIEIIRQGDNGEGIAIIPSGENAGKIIFVDGALIGEELEVDIVQNKSSFCRGVIKDIIKKSDSRVIAQCPYYDNCGGCNIQHMNRSCQETFKLNKVRSAINKIESVENIELIRVNNFEYRNKMVFPITFVDGKNVIGMFREKSHHVEKIDHCLIANKNINKVLLLTKEYLKNTNYKGYDFKQNVGDIKYLVVRSVNDQTLVTLVVSKSLDLGNYYKLLSENFDKIGLSIIISNNDKDILGGKYIQLFGIEHLELFEFGVRYKLTNLGFLQVNNEVKNEMYMQVLREISKSDRVIDAYSGAGLLTSIIAKKCQNAIGIEINKSASDSAKDLLKTNDINNVKFICGDVKDNIGEVLSTGDIVVLDPPRTGCDKSVLECLMQNDNSPKKIIYISCNLATLIRDLQLLEGEYNIKYAKAYDMFVQTSHVETLVVLEHN